MLEKTKCNVNSLPYPVDYAAGVFSVIGRHALICGGRNKDGVVLNSCLILTNDGKWEKSTNMEYARAKYTINEINGAIVAIGGINNKDEFGLPSAELFKDNRWSMLEGLDVDIHSHCTVVYDDVTLLVMGGIQNGKVTTHNVICLYYVMINFMSHRLIRY